jgi:hypothetical protein
VTVKGSNQPVGLFTYDLDIAAASEVAEGIMNGGGRPGRTAAAGAKRPPDGEPAAGRQQKEHEQQVETQAPQQPQQHRLPPMRQSVITRATAHLSAILRPAETGKDGQPASPPAGQQQEPAAAGPLSSISSPSVAPVPGPAVAPPLNWAAARARASIVRMETVGPAHHHHHAPSSAAAAGGEGGGGGGDGGSPGSKAAGRTRLRGAGGVRRRGGGGGGGEGGGEEGKGDGGDTADALIGTGVGGGAGAGDDWAGNPLVTQTWGLDWEFKAAWDGAVAVSGPPAGFEGRLSAARGFFACDWPAWSPPLFPT